MKGAIRLVALTNPPQRKDILIFDNKVSDVMRIASRIILLDVTGLGFYQFPEEKWNELQTLVIEYEKDYDTFIRSSYSHKTTTFKLPIQASQWQEILDKGLVGKEVEFTQHKFFFTNGNFTDHYMIARISSPSPKTYTEEEAKQLALDALDLGMRIRGEQLHPTGFIRKEWSGKSGKEIFNEWWKNK